MTDTNRVLLSVKVRAESKAELARLAAELQVSLSDVSRMALAKGMTVIKKERGIK